MVLAEVLDYGHRTIVIWERIMIIAAGEFRTVCLKLMDEVKRTGEEIVITKHGQPVAKLVPVTDTRRQTFGLLSDQTVIYGDLVEAIGEEWEADA
jgi:prevent-host-death family protein